MYSLITTPTNVRYLTAFTGTFGQVLMTTKVNYLLTDSRYAIAAAELVKRHSERNEGSRPKKQLEFINISDLGYAASLQKLIKKHRIKDLYFEADNLTVHGLKNYQKIFKNLSKLHPLGKTTKTATIEDLRLIKSTDEIKLMKKSQAINDEILSEIKKEIKPGLSERQIAWLIKEKTFLKGCEDIAFEPIVAINENSALPHHHPTDKKLKKGDMLLIDMGCKWQGYCSDMTRVIFTKKPTEMQSKIYNIVLEAQMNGINKARAGMKASEVDALARDVITEAGYGKEFGHSTGHGIGLDVHESPGVSGRSDEILKENSFITIEPGIYLPGQFGVRIEDIVLVKKDKVESITQSPKLLL